MMKVLLPYTKLTKQFYIYKAVYVRYDLNGKYCNWVDISNVAGSKWHISSYDIEPYIKAPAYENPNTPGYDTCEKAMDALDKILLNAGIILLNSEDEAQKYRILL